MAEKDTMATVEDAVLRASPAITTAADLTEELGLEKREVLDCLRLLEYNDTVESKKCGARAIAWWHVERVTPAPPRSPADHPDQCALEDVEVDDPRREALKRPESARPLETKDDDRDLEDELADRRVAPDVQGASVDAIEDALEGWRPGRDIEERRERREIGRTALDWLRDQEGDVRRQDVVAALYEDHNTGQTEDSWWRRLIRDAFNHAQERGYVENPGARWRWDDS